MDIYIFLQSLNIRFWSVVMFISFEKKEKIVSDFGRDAKDSGLTEVQVAFLTYNITNLQKHFKENKKDYHSRRRLLLLVSHRRKLLNYLKKKDLMRYSILIERLDLRR